MQSSRSNPESRNQIKSRYVGGKLVFYHPTTKAEIFRMDPDVTGGMIVPGMVKNIRTRFTIAQVNAGATILAAVTGFKYRLVDVAIIAIGGAAGAVTTVDILGTQSSSSVKLATFAQASLTQNTRLTADDATLLAAGASFVQNDAATALTIGKTGSSVTTATHFDVILSYALEA